MIKRRRPDPSADAPEQEPSSAPQSETDTVRHPEAHPATDQEAGESSGADLRLPDATESPASAERGRRRKSRKRARAGEGETERTNGRPASGEDTGAGESTGASQSPDGREPPNEGGTGEPPGSGDAPPPPRRGGKVVGVLALLLALVASGAAGWLGWRVLELEERVGRIPEERRAALEQLATQDAVDALERRLEQRGDSLEGRIADEVAALEQRLTRAEDERTEAIDRLRQRVGQAETAVQAMREKRERDGADWRMAEVRYLVSMAVRQLRITGDVAGGIAALEAADQALGQMGDPRVIDLRERIVQDIAALREVEPADVEGIALRVQNLAPRIPELVRAGEATAAEPDADGGASEPTESGGDEGWWKTLRERLGGLVTVRRESEAAPPDPTASAAAPSAELPPAERLLSALRDASRAALNHESQAYEAALGRALEILAAEYDDTAPANQRFRADLDDLRQRRVTTELPDLMPTLERTQALAARLRGSGDADGGR